MQQEGRRSYELVRHPKGAGAVETGHIHLKVVNANNPVYADAILCHKYDPKTQVEGVDEIYIAKPWNLRKGPFHNNGFHDGFAYQYTTPTQRTSVRQSDNQTQVQVINPPYHAGDILTADKWVSTGITVTVEGDETEHPEELVWMDDNRAGRAWARKA